MCQKYNIFKIKQSTCCHFTFIFKRNSKHVLPLWKFETHIFPIFVRITSSKKKNFSIKLWSILHISFCVNYFILDKEKVVFLLELFGLVKLSRPYHTILYTLITYYLCCVRDFVPWGILTGKQAPSMECLQWWQFSKTVWKTTLT